MPPPTRARDLLAVAVTLLVGLSLVRLAVDHAMLAHAGALRGHHRLTDAELPSIESWRHLVKVLVWVARLGLAAAVIAWTRRARAIVAGYDCYMFRTEQGFAVSGWLVPGMNAVAPYLLLSDVWTASDPKRRPDAVVSRIKPPRRILLCWILFLFSAFVGFMESYHATLVRSAWTPLDIHLDYVMTTAQLLSAGLLLWIVFRVTRFQETRYAGSRVA